MNTTETSTDHAAWLEHMATGKPLDESLRRRILQRGEQISEQIRQSYGEMDIAVELLHEIRDES